MNKKKTVKIEVVCSDAEQKKAIQDYAKESGQSASSLMLRATLKLIKEGM